MYIALLNIVPVLDLIGTIIGYIAQYKKIKQEKTSEGISIVKQVTHLLLIIMWILYGIEYCTLSYVVTCIISLVLCIFEIFLVVWYRENFTFRRLTFLSRLLGYKRHGISGHTTSQPLIPNTSYNSKNNESK